MNVRKFTASTSRGAWSLVREALGPDAVILSNRAVADGVEILALAGEDMASLAEPFVEKVLSETTLAALSPNYKPAQPAPLAIPAPAPAIRPPS